MICVTTPPSPDPLPLPRPPPPPPPPPPSKKTKDKQQEAAKEPRDATGMWCAGELTSARKHGIPIIPLYCDGYAFPDAESINNIQSVWTEEQQYTLTSHGISMEDIKAERGGVPLPLPLSLSLSFSLAFSLLLSWALLFLRLLFRCAARPPTGT